MRDNIHSKAQLTSGFDRIIEITGKPLTTEAFVSHVTRRYQT
ncbi:MAG: carboxypeptidase M32 [Gammaproteobacteria bacterium]|nr:carboxypeptidase M32 [Gammaproteobacteria bacterium]